MRDYRHVGRLNDRRTPLGELNWIFTAITDTIAWNVLPRDLFQRLFRQDLLLASLFRNYLLADRLMRSYNCTPISSPKLPPTHQHPLWASWDLAADLCLSQLPKLLSGSDARPRTRSPARQEVGDPADRGGGGRATNVRDAGPWAPSAGEYVHSPFFSEQLQAFQVWLEQGSDRKRVRRVSPRPPQWRQPRDPCWASERMWLTQRVGPPVRGTP